MDFLDPQKQKAHARRLALGYALIGMVVVLATTILLYRALGYGLDEEGRVIQNGLVFVSSHPEGADIYIDKEKYKDRTNARLTPPAGQYTMEITRPGYHIWKRTITVEGGVVERFDYPFLYPLNPAVATVKQYDAPPAFTNGSHDRRWMLVGFAASNEFDLYDLNAKKPAAQAVAVPADVLAVNSATKGWEVMEWAADNRHVLLRRAFERNGQPGNEYILFDREDPALSQNLSILFGFSPTALTFHGRAFDKFYAYDQNSGQVLTVEINRPTPQPYLSNVLAFAADGDRVLYVTNKDAPSGKVLVRMREKADTPYTLRQLPADTLYLLRMGNYDGDLFVAAGASGEHKVYVYKQPLEQLKDNPDEVLAPVQILKVTAPTYVSFSPNKRIIMAENADRFAVYDAETDRGYAYQLDTPLDAPQTHAAWMDGFRMGVVSGGRLVAFDFDGANRRKLSAASPALLPIHDRDYRYLYTVNAQNALTRTALLTEEDL